MAPTAAEIALRADIGLDAVRRFVGDLPGLEKEWEDLSEYNQAVLMMEWAQSVDSLIELDEDARAGQLTPGQLARLAALKHDIRGLLPLITKLGWYQPPRSLLEEAA